LSNCGPASVIFGKPEGVNLSEKRTEAVTGEGGNWYYTPDEAGEGGLYTVTGGEVTFTGYTKTSRIVVEGVATVTLSDVTIDQSATDWGVSPFSLSSGARVEIRLSGTNTLTAGGYAAGVTVQAGDWDAETTLKITSAAGDKQESGHLTAQGGHNGAGIGGGYRGGGGSITISGGTIVAKGGAYGSGIGSGVYAQGGGTIKIEGGRVSASGGPCGAGIGSGAWNFTDSAGQTTSITGGYVEATGWDNGSGIGGGAQSAAGAISINWPDEGGTSHGIARASVSDSLEFGCAVGTGAFFEAYYPTVIGGSFNGRADWPAYDKEGYEEGTFYEW
jgi:hypothetical protein